MKIFCIGRNYENHAKELNNPIPDEPVVFMKPKSALVHKGKPLIHPLHTIEWEYEAEIVIKISKNGKEIPPDMASMYYNQYTIGLDMTSRDVQRELKKKGLPWELAKAHDGSAVVGRFIPITRNTDINDINFHLNLNHKEVQRGNTGDMIFDFDELVSYISQYFTINIGDLIFTGTPPGVGEVNPGDILQGYVEGEELLKVKVL